MGIEPPAHGPLAWLIRPAPRLDARMWERFFRGLRGQPRLVVGDLDRSIRNGVESAFGGQAAYYACEWHTHQRLDPLLGALPSDHALRGDLLERALYSEADWHAFVRAVRREHTRGTELPGAARFIRRHGRWITEQLSRRLPGDPRSASAVEAIAQHLGEILPRRRANRLGNLARTTHLLDLVTTDLRGLANEAEWAVRLRVYLRKPRRRHAPAPAPP
jgi:hypothetical protein